MPPAPGEVLGHGAEHVDAQGDFEQVLKGKLWGMFRITPKQPTGSSGGRFGGFQARCPWHRRNDQTECKTFFRLEGPSQEERERCLRRLLFWCARATEHPQQRNHISDDAPLNLCPSNNFSFARKTSVRPDIKQFSDVELDRLCVPLDLCPPQCHQRAAELTSGAAAGASK
jgi:hypothetical protein